eukprot:TRINITY_DN10844_c0_g1_i1.p1 TRINITY_DN10844_c0_g1~~TRINITY_DN10844_c0_g1_i1.p1  ORF type:complete len:286 (+),score=82.47 TRINITY_DN10844_c0_g1_i1:172-1029(+)
MAIAWWLRMALRVLRCGPIPRHVAFILDGNRRYARKNKLAPHLGHVFGFEKLKEVLELCWEAGIKAVTIYAFSIENFKRPATEVDMLMQMVHDKISELRQSELMKKYEVAIRVWGDLSLVSPALRTEILQLVADTRHNTQAELNVCFAYTSRHEIVQATQRLASAVQAGALPAAAVGEAEFDAALDSQRSTPDLLLRTSGEFRLSDFLLWQSSFSQLAFVDVLWPEFNAFHMCQAILRYQHDRPLQLELMPPFVANPAATHPGLVDWLRKRDEEMLESAESISSE